MGFLGRGAAKQMIVYRLQIDGKSNDGYAVTEKDIKVHWTTSLDGAERILAHYKEFAQGDTWRSYYLDKVDLKGTYEALNHGGAGGRYCLRLHRQVSRGKL